MSNSSELYEKPIHAALDKAYGEALIQAGKEGAHLAFDLKAARIIMFSDQHRGVRDGADDFCKCEKAYNAALGYYLESGHTLMVLGDAEELWECRPHPVVDAYRYTLGLENEFLKRGRYYRIFGNHDDLWSEPGAIDRHFTPKITREKTPVRKSLLLRFTGSSGTPKRMFLIHGHQGTFDSDRGGKISRILVRHVWGAIQRIFKIRSTTPAKDAELRDKHNIALYNWAARDRGEKSIILVAGHTHLPVFASTTHIGMMTKELANLQARLRVAAPGSADSADLAQETAELRAAVEFIKAKGEGGDITMQKPCYFNTGCCSFSDGDVTGIEIADGEVRLVRWPDDTGAPKAKILSRASLEQVLNC